VTVDPDIAGLTTSGDAALPNGGDGLLIRGHAHGNVIGGSRRSVIPQNTFSGNAGYGIAITGHAHGNRVFASFIGTAILGVDALANRGGGILIGGSAYRNSVGPGPLSAAGQPDQRQPRHRRHAAGRHAPQPRAPQLQSASTGSAGRCPTAAARWPMPAWAT